MLRFGGHFVRILNVRSIIFMFTRTLDCWPSQRLLDLSSNRDAHQHHVGCHYSTRIVLVIEPSIFHQLQQKIATSVFWYFMQQKMQDWGIYLTRPWWIFVHFVQWKQMYWWKELVSISISFPTTQERREVCHRFDATLLNYVGMILAHSTDFRIH